MLAGEADRWKTMIKHQENTKCPICNGTGTVHTGFYGTGHCSTRDLIEDRFRCVCYFCKGKGVISEPDPENLPIVQDLRKQLEQVTKERDDAHRDCKARLRAKNKYLEELKQKLVQVTRERDYLSKSLVGECRLCSHNFECAMDPQYCTDKDFKWAGIKVKEGEDNEG